MLASDLIKQLESVIEEFGDLNVVCHEYDERRNNHIYKEYEGIYRSYVASYETHLDINDNVLPNMCQVVVITTNQDN